MTNATTYAIIVSSGQMSRNKYSSEEIVMRKRILSIFLVLTMIAVCMVGCGGKKTDDTKAPLPDEELTDPSDTQDNQDVTDDQNTPDDPDSVVEENHDNQIRSVLTNEWISDENQDLRPVAMMIPNDKGALPHYNISNAGVLYQCQVEGRITRLMALFDDYNALSNRIGNVRSARTYYVYWAMEWDALFVHFGNPWYVDAILQSGHVADINLLNLTKGTEASGGATTESGMRGMYYRASDRSAPQNAYVSPASIVNAANSKGYSLTYTDSYKGAHYQFADEKNPVDLSTSSDAKECLTLDMAGCYPIDKTYFMYDSEKKQYMRYEYGAPHVDEETGEQLAFKNIIVQFCPWRALDAKGYLEFYFKQGMSGYYITEGYAIPITWEKEDDFDITRYYDAAGNEITLNTGKTMVCIVEDSDMNGVVIK